MYIPTWLVIIIVVIVLFLILKFKKRGSTSNNSINSATSVEDIENGIPHLKEGIFSLEHFDSPHFIDCQDAFDTMEVNYLRLKQRLSHDPQKVLEIAKD